MVCSKSLIGQIYGRARVPLVISWDKVLRRYKPRAVVLVVNNACNLKCKYCFGSYCERTSENDFTTEMLKNIIDDLAANGTIYLTVHGGETLLRQDIGEIVRHMKSRGMYVNLITNGTLLKNKLEEIRCVDSLCISLDGREEGNDRIRGKGSFRVAMQAIDLIKATGIPLRVSATLTKHTQHDMQYLAELAREKKFNLDFSLLFQSTPNMQEFLMSEDETRDVLRELIELKKNGYPIFTSFRSLKIALNWPLSYDNVCINKKAYDALRQRPDVPSNIRPLPCYFSKYQVTIDADGRMFPCFSWNKTFDSLNVKDVGVKTAFEHTLRHTDCVLCPTLSHNDWNSMMTLSPAILVEQAKLHLREIFNWY